ncbi:MAG: HEAT repeat domain-containing protein [Ardenticatenales bacterium]
MRLTGKGLHAALALIERVDKVGGVRDMIALAVQVDGWVSHGTPIPLGAGAVHGEPGFPLGVDPGSGQAMWLLEGARLLVAPPGLGRVDDPTSTAHSAAADPEAAVFIYDLADAPIAREVIADRLRRALLGAYVHDLGLPDKDGPVLIAAVGELLTLAGEVDVRARAILLDALDGVVAAGPVEHWAHLALRLRAGFERALSDRAPESLDVAVRALVRLAAVGPFPPQEPRAGARILTTLFNFPRPEIHATALRALNALPAAALAQVGDTVRPLADAALSNPDADVRRLASDLELRLRGEETLPAATAIVAGDAAERGKHLRALAVDPDHLIVLLPRVLEALRDADGTVRRAALDAVDPVLSGQAGDARLRQRVIEALVSSADEQLEAAGLAAIDHAERPVDDKLAEAALRTALDGPAALRKGVVERLAARYAEAPSDGAAEAFLGLLRHSDPIVREATLDSLGTIGATRARLRDLLTHALMEQLRDPNPTLRAACGRALLAMGFPNAAGIVVQAVVDADARVRQALIEALRATGDVAHTAEAERLARAVDAVCRGTAAVEGDERLRWTTALAEVVDRRGPRTVPLLLSVLATIPPEAVDPFLQFAIGEIDRHLVTLADGEDDTIGSMCRRLLDGPTPQPVHAARLAGERVADDAAAFDFLWTMMTAGLLGHATAARMALARLTQTPKSPPVLREIAQAYWSTSDAAKRDVLRGWYGAVPPLPRG